MNVLFDHQAFQMQKHGGVSRYALCLAEQITQTGECDISLFCGFTISRMLDDVPLSVRRIGPTVRIPELRYTGKIRTAVNRAMFRSCIRGLIFDVYHPTYFLDVRPIPKAALVVTMYDCIYERFRDSIPGSAGVIEARKRVINQAHLILAISEFTKRDLVEFYGVDPERIHVTYLASNLDSGDLKKTCVNPVILFVGPRRFYKNFSVLVEAMRNSKWLSKEFRVECIGGGAQAKGEPGESEGFQYLAALDDEGLRTRYQESFCLVYPSLCEGFGLPILEAMTNGCPVVTTECGSLPEVGGDAAVYFEGTSWTSLEAAIQKLMDDETRNRFIELGIKNNARFSWSRCASETISGYKTALLQVEH